MQIRNLNEYFFSKNKKHGRGQIVLKRTALHCPLREVIYFIYSPVWVAQLIERSSSKAMNLGSIPGQGRDPAVGWGDIMFE